MITAVRLTPAASTWAAMSPRVPRSTTSFGLAGVGNDRRRAVRTVVRRQLGDDLLDALDGEVQHQRRAGRAEAGQVLARRHRRGPLRDPGQHHRLADAGHGELAAAGPRRPRRKPARPG